MSWVQHRSNPLMITTTGTNVVTECTHSSVLYSVRRDQMCHISDFLASTVKYESEANASRKLDTRSDLRKGAFDMLEI
jgi:hypothetical protein